MRWRERNREREVERVVRRREGERRRESGTDGEMRREDRRG